MGRKCAVPHCYTGYRKCKEKASLYRVPDDDFFLNKWQEAIAREDRPITPKDYVCEKHFTNEDILRRRVIKDVIEEYQRPRLKPDAIPSIFPDLPEFILKMVKKRRKISTEELNKPKTESETETATENNKTETNIMIEEIKAEPLSICEPDSVAKGTSESILNNEIIIKSESEGENTTESVGSDRDNDKEDPCFGPKMHRCDQCDYQTKYAHNLRTHKSKHLTGEGAYLRCKYCPNFKTKWELTHRNHLKIKHGIGKQEVFRCTVCQFETKVKLCLKRHSERHKREGPINDTNLYVDSFKKVAEMGEKQKAFKCTECFYETNSKTHIIRHIKSTHNTGDDIEVPISDPKPKSNPEKVNSGKRPFFKCPKCPYKSRTQECLLKHVFRHKYPEPGPQEGLKNKTWKCPKCPYATFFQNALQRHEELECGYTYICANCSFKTNSKVDYISHTLTHRLAAVKSINVTAPVCDESVRGEVQYIKPDPDGDVANKGENDSDNQCRNAINFVSVGVKQEPPCDLY